MSEKQHNDQPRTAATSIDSGDLIDADGDLHAAYLLGYYKRNEEIRRLTRRCEQMQTALRSLLDWAPSPPEHWRDRDKQEWVRYLDAARDVLASTVEMSDRAKEQET